MTDTAPASVNTHADLAGLLQQASALQAHPPAGDRIQRAVREGHLTINDGRWVNLAVALVRNVVEQLGPGVLRSSDDLSDEPPLFTTRRLFRGVEQRLARIEEALGLEPADA